jgi:CheY-like chemotaxis protein
MALYSSESSTSGMKRNKRRLTVRYQVKKRVLVIDDIGIILELVEFLLQMGGYDVVTATDAASALAQIMTTMPDLILLDIMMPNMSGYEFIAQLRQRQNHYATIPIMLLTVKEHTPEEVEQLGAVGYLRKPFHQKELLSKIDELLSDTDNDTP